ncbi:MAG: M14 family zinc carboxypeptidase [Gemmatimonadota bacterium]
MNARTNALRICSAVLALSGAVVPAPSHGQQLLEAQRQATSAGLDYYFPPGVSFVTGVPSPEQFLGYPIGSYHTRHDQIVAYMKELAASSDRATYQEIGTTFEHRVMPVLTVTSPGNHARLEEIRTRHIAASEADGDLAAAADLPVIVHLGYGVHGNEPSGSEAALLTAYWLVAGQGEVLDYLDNGVFHIEPNLNPDGRDRHTWWANINRAEPMVADPLDREHNEVWPGGRTNHYWFDLNRDWLPLVNPESKARIEWHHHWRPNVVTDYHEMGTSSSYFFEPSEPVGSWNPLLPERLYTDITMRFADDWAAALDTLGSLYFTREVFDNSYPGYGSTYPNFLGGLGLVFEQASSRGHIQESTHHGILTFPFTIRNHLRTALATVRVSVEEREVMREYQHEFFTTAMAEAEDDPVRGWIFGDSEDASINDEFLDLLRRHRIRVHEANESRTVGGHVFEQGRAWVVPAEQPQYRLARSIFERTETFPDSVFYDASTWVVSLAYGIPDAELRDDLPLGAVVGENGMVRSVADTPESSVAYVLDWRDTDAPVALQALQARGVRGEVATRPFSATTSLGPVDFSRGTISMPVRNQNLSSDDLLAAVRDVARSLGVTIHAATSTYSVSGPDLGSGAFAPVRAPRVLLPVGEGISGYEAGQMWHLLDQRIGMPVTKVDASDIGRVDWSRYDVLVLVSGNLSFLQPQLDELRRWVRGGGTLVAIRAAAAWAARNELTPNVAAPSVGRLPGEAMSADGPARIDYERAGDLQGAQAIGGSIWQADLDLTHPLGFGYTRRFLPVWRDHSNFFAVPDNPYITVAQLTDDPHLSGYVSDENHARLPGSPSVIADQLGGGSVVLLIDNPNFRGYWRGTSRLLLNALWFGDLIRAP